MANIYELTADLLRLQAMLLQADEENEAEIAEALQIADAELEGKAEGYAHVIRNIEADISALKAEEQRLNAKRKSAEKAAERLKSTLYEAMVRTGKTKIKAGTFDLKIAQNGGALPVILDVDVNELPDDLVKVKKEADKKAIAEYIEATGDISYAHYGERGSSLRIK